MVSATICATNEGGAGRPVIAAPFRMPAILRSRYETGHNHESAPSAISRPVGRPSLPGRNQYWNLWGLGDVTSVKELAVIINFPFPQYATQNLHVFT